MRTFVCMSHKARARADETISVFKRINHWFYPRIKHRHRTDFIRELCRLDDVM